MKSLILPPYISTSWKNVASLHVESGPILVVNLVTGARIEVPHLNRATLEGVFAAHAEYLNQEAEQKKLPFLGIENFALQHNMDQANSPDLPPELIERLSAASHTLPIDRDALPKPEPHCNCPHCQIMRAMQNTQTLPEEEIVSDEELSFRTWDIAQSGDKLYTVSNPLDGKEHYTVFLGEPLGCTCGQNHCEHIQAVLHT